MDNFVIGTIQENIKTLSNEIQVLNSNTPSKLIQQSIKTLAGELQVLKSNKLSKLDDISNVTITSAQNDQYLKYSGGEWINASVAPGGGATYTNGTGVTITANEINIGQSVGTTDVVQFAAVSCSDKISTNTISGFTTGGGITITGSVNMTGIPESANSNKLLYNVITGQITHQADTGGGAGSNDVVDKTTDQTIGGFKNFSDFMGIGIGATQSEWPLRIGSGGSRDALQPNNLWFYAHNALNGIGDLNGTIWPYGDVNTWPLLGLYVDEGIRAGRLYIMSDRRIKKDIVDIQDDEALNKLRILQPKKYKYIDPLRGTQEVYGFIAQEVAEVIPYSVSLENSYLPSHMIFCKIINTTVNTSTIDTKVSHTLIVNDFICFRDNKYNLIEGVKVIEIIDDKTIKVDRIFNKEDTVYTTTTGETVNDVIYLYGKKIDDFHTLNKDTIWTVATAALQEVDRQLQAEKSKTSDLISRIESLEARLETLEGLEARITLLESK